MDADQLMHAAAKPCGIVAFRESIMHLNTGRLVLASASSFMAMAFAGSAHAQAFYLQEQSVRAQGRAFSGAAADTGVDSLWWNPAAIAGMEGGEAAVHSSVVLPPDQVSDEGTVIVPPTTEEPHEG